MKSNLKVISILLALFIISQLLGIIILDRNIDIAATKEKGEPVFKKIYIAGVELEKPKINPTWSFVYIALAVLIGTLLIFGIIKLKLLVLWKLWFFLAAMLCITISLTAFLPSRIALLAGIVLAIYKIFKPNVFIHNLTEPLIYSGIAVIFVPIINMVSMFILLILISLYDAYAVWKSKHMITLAKLQTKTKLFSGMLIPYTLKRKAKEGLPKQRLTTVKTAILGGGDVAFPLLFTGVIFKGYGFWALLIIPFTALALFLLFYKGKKDKFYPAMPFLSVGCIAGFLLIIMLRAIIQLL